MSLRDTDLAKLARKNRPLLIVVFVVLSLLMFSGQLQSTVPTTCAGFLGSNLPLPTFVNSCHDRGCFVSDDNKAFGQLTDTNQCKSCIIDGKSPDGGNRNSCCSKSLVGGVCGQTQCDESEFLGSFGKFILDSGGDKFLDDCNAAGMMGIGMIIFLGIVALSFF